jgi:hypothetical protein
MTTDKTTIGVYNEWFGISIIITVEELRERLKDTVYTPKQFCDWRYSTSLSRFIYDPYTGEKIDWKRVRDCLTR